MKKLLLTCGIVLFAACLALLILALLSFLSYRHVFDGSADLYDRLQRRMIVFFASGIVCAVIGTVCMLCFSRM